MMVTANIKTFDYWLDSVYERVKHSIRDRYIFFWEEY